MSAENFRALFNNPAFAYWYTKELSEKNASTTSFIGIGRQDAKSFVEKSVGDFILSKEQLVDIFGEGIATKLINNAKNNYIELFDVVSYRNVAGQEQLVFPDIKFSSANKEIARLLTVIGSDIDKNRIIGSIETYFQNNPQDIGHIFGFANTLLARSKESAKKYLLNEALQGLKRAKSIGEPVGVQEARIYLKNTIKQLRSLEEFIDSMIDVLEEYDIASSQIKGLDLEINAKYRKTASTWAFTWEASSAQQAVGSKLATILGTIKQTKAGGKGVRGLFATLFLKRKTQNDNLVKDVINNFVQEFVDKSIANPSSPSLSALQQKSSPSLVELIEDSIQSVLAGKPKKFNNSYTGSIDLKPVTLLRIKNNSTKKAVAELKQQKSRLKNTKTRVLREETRLKDLKFNFATVNVLNLQNLINGNLHDQIKKNMGTGSSTNVLNYRTGRLAESAKIERMSESREGMITAFYSYMKNPYATFSKGGRQERPTSRDPKLLISKSIRELAGAQVANRMRAVLV